MKKFLEAWKLWTTLSILIFFLTCGVFIVHATATNNTTWDFSNKYQTWTINNILTDSVWNNLMADLDKLIPTWAVVAFTSNECPEWWFDYKPANWRFIVWIWSATMPDWAKHSYTNNVGKIWWDYRTKLTVQNLPPHNHEIFIEYRWDDSADARGDVVWIGHHKADWYQTKWTGYWYTENKWQWTNGDMNGTAFNTKIPYIGLKYCVKWEYNSVDECENGYSNIETLNCSQWYEIGNQTQSSLGWFTCGQCVKSTCAYWLVECYEDLNWWNNYGVSSVIKGYAGDAKCVNETYCCASKWGEARDLFQSYYPAENRNGHTQNEMMTELEVQCAS